MSVSGAAETGPSPGGSVEVGRFTAGLRRRWRWMFWPTLLAALGSTTFVMVTPPHYTGVAKVLLEDQESYFTRPDKAPGFEPTTPIDSETVQSQAEAATSSDLARRTVARLDLMDNAEFNPSGVNNVDGGVDQRVVDKFLSRLTVFPVPRSHVLQFEFVSRNPALAARGANVAADVFLQSQTEAKAHEAKKASEWLSRKIDELRAKVADAEAKVEAFRAESGLLAGANGQTMSTQQLSDLNAQLASARSAASAAQAKVELLRRLEQDGRLDEAPPSITDDAMRRLADQRAGVKTEIAEASRTLLPLHPRMKELNAQLSGLDAQIRDAAERNARLLENEARLASDQVATLSTALAQQSKTVAAGNVDDVRLRGLEMDAKAARDQLKSYLQKYREAAAHEADNAAPADARIIATAEPPRTPTFPKAWQTVLLATLAAFVSSAGVAAAATLASEDTSPAPRAPAPLPLPPALAPPAPPEPRQEAAPDTGPAEPPPAFEASAALATGTMSAPEELAARLLRFKPAERSLTALVSAAGTGRALPLALETARALSRRGSTLLVDLGATQAWFADILDREKSSSIEIAGLFGSSLGESGLRRGDSSRSVVESGRDPVRRRGWRRIIACRYPRRPRHGLWLCGPARLRLAGARRESGGGGCRCRRRDRTGGETPPRDRGGQRGDGRGLFAVPGLCRKAPKDRARRRDRLTARRLVSQSAVAAS